MTKNTMRLLPFIYIMLISLFLFSCSGNSSKPVIDNEITAPDDIDKQITVPDVQSEIVNILTTYAPYDFNLESVFEIDDRSIIFEDAPANSAEEVIAMDFLYSITGEIDKKYNILADIEPHSISIENEKIHFTEGRSMRTYIIHKFTTLTEEQYNHEFSADSDIGDLTYFGWHKIVEEYGLVEYEIVNVEFTQYLSPEMLILGPQWGDGFYSRSFIVGKNSEDTAFLIYSFGFM